MSQLLTNYPDENFENFFQKILFFFITFGTWREVFGTIREKILAWAKCFSFLAKVFQLACQNWNLFVHLGSFKFLKNSQNHRGTTWKFFRIFRLFWNLVEHRAWNFLPFDKKISVGDSKLTLTSAERIIGEKTLFSRIAVLWRKFL